MKKVGINAVFNVIKTVLSLVFPLITFSYASRIFLTDGIGQLDFSKALVSFFVLMATSGITNYGTREAAKVRDNRNLLSHLAQELLCINVITAVVAYTLFFLTLILVPGLKVYHTLLLINSLTIILNVIGMEWLFNAMEDFKYIAIRTVIIQILCLVCMFIFVKTKQDLWKYALIQVFAVSGNSLCNFFRAPQYIDFRKHESLQLKKHIKPLLYIFCSWLFIQVFTHLDTVMLGIMGNDSMVGLYSASHKISTMAASVITSATLVLMPRISYYCEKQDYKQIHSLVKDAISLVLMIAIPGVIGLACVSRETLLLFSGEGFLQANLTTKIMAGRVILVPLNSFIVLHLFISLKQDRKNILSTATAAGLNLVLNYLLIPRFAQNGAAIATVAAELIQLVINLYFLRKIMPRLNIMKDLLQFSLAAVLIIPVTIACNLVFEHIVFRLAVIIFMSVILYMGALFVMKNKQIFQISALIMGKLQKRVR